MRNNHQRKRIITILIILSILAGLIVILWSTLRKSSSDSEDLSPSLPLDSARGKETADTLSGWEGYAHPSLPFAFAYPKELTPVAFQDGEAEIVLLGGKKSGTEVQIVIRAFDESGPLTVERIQRDASEMAIDEPQNVLIGSAQIPALLFWSKGDSTGKTREVWFVQDGYLYQVSTKAENDELLAGMMETWTFE